MGRLVHGLERTLDGVVEEGEDEEALYKADDGGEDEAVLHQTNKGRVN